PRVLPRRHRDQADPGRLGGDERRLRRSGAQDPLHHPDATATTVLGRAERARLPVLSRGATETPTSSIGARPGPRSTPPNRSVSRDPAVRLETATEFYNTTAHFRRRGINTQRSSDLI